MTRLTLADHDRIHRVALARAAQLRGEALDRFWSVLAQRIVAACAALVPHRDRSPRLG